MSKPAKQALITQLTAALIPVLTPLSAPLPNGIAQAVEELADSILRWQARQGRSPRPAARRRTEETDRLAQLLDSRLHEEEEALPPG